MKKEFKLLLCLVIVFVVACSIPIYSQNSANSANKKTPLNQSNVAATNPYVVERFVVNGKSIDKIIVPGPPSPPPGFIRPTVAELPVPNIAAGINVLANVPASTWAFGCSATSAAMMFGYYDNIGYLNMYAGPTNGGLYPLTNASWGTALISGEDRALNPLSATRNGLDGRAIRGHVDDYWIKYGNTASDPFITNCWTEHTQGECTGDYMGTNQSLLGNSDGSTTFYNYGDGSPLYDYTGCEPAQRDGCHGMRLFIESRGYALQSSGNFNQYIYGYGGNTLGFTYNDFKAEIDAGRPVLIQVSGHTMLGFGYDTSGSIVYIHDTWDYANHTMTWGGTYSGMTHYGVTVIKPVPVSNYYYVFEGNDFNNAGGADIAVYRPSNNFWYLRGVGSYSWGTSGDIPVTGDYDNDGSTDIAIFRPSSGKWIIRRSSTGTALSYPWGANGDVPVPADFDGDGQTDAAVWRTAIEKWYIKGSAGTNLFILWGNNTDIPVPGDYGGDGKADIAVFRQSAGKWYIRRSSAGTLWTVTWGAAGDIAVPADYDGDNLIDIAVFRESTGKWYIMGSKGTNFTYSWGKSGDTPAPGDYDNDGKADVAVFRPSNGKWYVQGSGGTNSTYAWGTSGDVAVAER
jgi:hypothetical protein